MRELCAECFPITYPDRWYSYITSDQVGLYPVFRVCTYLVRCVMDVCWQVYSLSAWTEGSSGSGESCSRASGSGIGLVGMLVAEVQGLEQLEGEGVLALERSEPNTTAMYVISLG